MLYSLVYKESNSKNLKNIQSHFVTHMYAQFTETSIFLYPITIFNSIFGT